MPSSAKSSVERNGVVARITAILESFTRETPRLPLRDIALAAGLPASTTRRLLVQLESSGLVFQDPDSQLYAPTPKLAYIGALALHGTSLEEVSRPALRRLSEASGEAAFLGALRGHEVTYLAHETAAREVTISIQTGDSRPALSTAIGTVIIAHNPPLYTEGSPEKRFDLDELQASFQDRFGADVDLVREQGYVVGSGGLGRDSTSIAVPVAKPGRETDAAIAISGPSYRFSREQALALLPALLSEARDIAQTFTV